MLLQKPLFKFTVLLIAFLSMVSCKDSDDDSVDPERDLFFFLEKTDPQFSADLNDDFILWQTFPLGDFSSNGSASFPSGDTDSTIKEITYFMIQGSMRISITAPVYDTASPAAIQDVFGLGFKSLGAEDSDYKIAIESGSDSYNICLDDSTAYQMEIIKTEEDEFGALKVWFVIDDINLNTCDEDTSGTFNNGLFLARFFDYSAVE